MTYIIVRGLLLNLMYCWRSAINTEADSIPVVLARSELSFPWQFPAAVTSLYLFGVHITQPKVVEFDFPEPS